MPESGTSGSVRGARGNSRSYRERYIWPFDGGTDELSGVLVGRSSLASRFSSSAMRAWAASNCPTSGSSDRMRASFSATVSLLRSISGVTRSLNRVARGHVNHHFQARQPSTQPAPAGLTPYPGEQLLK